MYLLDFKPYNYFIKLYGHQVVRTCLSVAILHSYFYIIIGFDYGINKDTTRFSFKGRTCLFFTSILDRIQKQSPRGVLLSKGVRRNFGKFIGKHLCESLFFNIKLQAACNFIKKAALAQVFSCEFCEISKNTFFAEHLLATVSEMMTHGFVSDVTLSYFHLVPETIKH